MDEQTRGFRSAIFGGFNREDVMHYIEETDTKYYTETAELRSQLTEAQSAMNELRTQNEALTAKNAELLERLGEMTLDTDKIRAQLDQIESGFSLQATEIEAQNARAAQLAAENDRLTSENAKLSAKCGEYDATREKIAEMELSAYRRAKQIEEVAKNLSAKGIETKEFAFTDTNDVSSVTQAACDWADVIYVPTDNIAGSNTEAIANVTVPAKTPVIAGEEGICKGCGVATLSISYYDLGMTTGKMAAKILTGEADISTMPIEFTTATPKYNASMCETLGITPLEGYTAIAE